MGKTKHIQTKQQLIASFAAWNGNGKADKTSSFTMYTSFLESKKNNRQYSAMKLAALYRKDLMIMAESWGVPFDAKGLDEWRERQEALLKENEALDKEFTERIARD